MELRKGKLVPDSETPIGEGINAATRGLIEVDGELKAAVIKRLPKISIAAECFCALLFNGWGIPVPEPVLVECESCIAFGSLDVGYPSLKQRIGWNEAWPTSARNAFLTYIAEIICAWPETPKAIAADEAVGNVDRNIGNFLWDGESRAFIDHEQTLGLRPDLPDINKLVQISLLAHNHKDIERGAIAAALSLPHATVDDVNRIINEESFLDFLRHRLPIVTSRVLSRYPQPNDLFAGLPL